MIKGLQFTDDKYEKNARQLDNVVILQSKSKASSHRKLVAFKHVKAGESYDSEVLASLDISEYPNYEIRIASADKLRRYDFPKKDEIINKIYRGQYPILLANPKDDAEAILLIPASGKKFEEIKITRQASIWDSGN